MKQIANKVITGAADEAVDILKSNIEGTVYAWEPNMYERTGEFLEQIQIISRDYYGSGKDYEYTGLKYEIGSDPQKMNLYPKYKDGDGKIIWGKHQGLSGEDFRSSLFDALNNGTEGSKYDHPQYDFMDSAFDDIQDEVQDAKAIYKWAGGLPSGIVLRRKF